MSVIWLIPALLTLACCTWFLMAAAPRVWVREPELERGSAAPHKITAKSLLPLLIIVLLYSVVAFWKLGSTETPQSFASFKDGDLTLKVGQSVGSEFELRYYSGLDTGSYTLYASEDGENWTFAGTLDQNWVALFKWHKLSLPDLPPTTKYLRFEADNRDMELGEVYLNSIVGKFSEQDLTAIVPLTADDERAKPLVDEPGLTADVDDWMYNTYFDEIYHPRTAFEHMRQISPYEVTHPPLGKIILSLGIRAFGMNPFGWRFVGTLIGILMLIPLYLFVQNMFGKPLISSCATILLASEFMHYVQTRIGTVDTEVVFFILLMYYFMYRYVTLPEDAPLGKNVLWLSLSGVTFGLAAASKWVAIYGAIGLAWMWGVKIYHIAMFSKKQHLENAKLRKSDQLPVFRAGTRIAAITVTSVVVFIAIPAVIYVLSYIPYAQAHYGASADGTLSGYLKMVWENQKYMLEYHGNLNAEHPYSSPWYAWLFDVRPILYFQWFNPGGMQNTESVFGAFTNPLITWAGLGAMAFMVRLALKGDRKAHLIFAGWLAQLLPWIFISRIAFAYHYFPNVIFLILALARLMQSISETPETPIYALRNSSLITGVNRLTIVGFTAVSVVLFALFFPALSGNVMSTDYAALLRWFGGSYPF